MKILTLFFVLSIVNVIFSTVRTIVTVKGSKLSAALLSGGYFAYYNIMLIYTVADFPMWQKCLITFICNVIGVYIVKYMEDKSAKDKLWKIEFTVPLAQEKCLDDITWISHSKIKIDEKHFLYVFYCKTRAQSKMLKDYANEHNAKYFITESKNF